MPEERGTRSLDPIQQLTVAYAYFVKGVQQQVLADLMSVNAGRISEACKRVGSVIGLTPPGYKDREKEDQ
ncbi:hypothetical protein M2322_002825 [Rhodoblastus acidophilus]|uniref:hypothetical protein n=1 Tax=Rhodoblastus acidophilus TaxID=1074 RepID=UPI0022246BE3|nr:hypothetical protein [Rhodoblastus acidophilus]MCW2317266.1 hypothetical protein [Rhodoblastus acidophilus]